MSIPLYIEHWENLHYPLSGHLHDRLIHDIQNGAAFLTLNDELQGLLSQPTYLGVVLCTGGVAVWKSSQQSVWPVYLAVTNLPPSLCMKKENFILCGLWLGDSKPSMDTFLKPILKMLRMLRRDGLEIHMPAGVRRMHVVLLLGVFDLVTKVPILRMKQFNGYFGCTTCLHPSVDNCHTHTITYPPEPGIDVREPTHASILQAA